MNIFKKISHWYLSRSALPYWCVLFVDLVICYLSGILVFWFYYRGAVTLGNIIPLSRTIGIYLLFNLIGYRLFHTYSGIVRYSSIEDLRHIVCAQAVSLFFALCFHYLVIFKHLPFLPLVGRQILLMYIFSTVLMWVWRLVVKEVFDVLIAKNDNRPVLIYGVHAGAAALARSIRSGGNRRFRLVGFISPDPKIEHKFVMGKRVYGKKDDLEKILRDKHIEAILVSPIAMRYFRNDTDLQNYLLNLGIHIFVMRNMEEWHEGQEITSDSLKDVDVADLLPRDEIHVDMEAIGRMLRDRTILITGAAGSIGSEMVRQIAKYKPAMMILVDQAETPQHDIMLMMKRKFPDIKNKVVVASICQKTLMERIFAHWHPDYVFHAAAYKHVPMMETEPAEAILNNVRGTKFIADLSVKYGVKKFVMISTDKAVNPTNVMGCSKRLCEIYTQSLNSAQTTTEFVTTRFGNVLGSNGSVIPIFEKQIRNGGPVTVTDPHVTRFFMLIPEACELVLEAGTHGRGGQIFVFDMGQSVRIADLAERMIKLSGAKNVHIVYTGLRPGEKLYEEVLADQEST